MTQTKYAVQLNREQMDLICAGLWSAEAHDSHFRPFAKEFQTLRDEIAQAEKQGAKINKEKAKRRASLAYHMEEAALGIL